MKMSAKIGQLLVVASIVFATWAITNRYDRAQLAYWHADAIAELLPLAAEYGPDHFSRDAEEWIIRDVVQNRRGGVFLDVGANHYRNQNNTYYLESRLGWSGIAVDALPEFRADYEKYRPHTRFVAMFASDTAGESVPFFVPNGQQQKLVASANASMPRREGYQTTTTQVPTTTLNRLLEDAAIAHVDFVSMDIELAEPKALAGFDIDRFRPALVCIEAHPDVRQQILDYFQRHGYVLIGKYLRADVKNLYFRPAPPI